MLSRRYDIIGSLNNVIFMGVININTSSISLMRYLSLFFMFSMHDFVVERHKTNRSPKTGDFAVLFSLLPLKRILSYKV
jgi:hypothetical protein